MPSRRVEDRIRDLCAQAVSAPDSELEPILKELRATLRAHSERLRKLAVMQLVEKKGRKERRRPKAS